MSCKEWYVPEGDFTCNESKIEDGKYDGYYAINFSMNEDINGVGALVDALYEWLQNNYSPHTSIIIEYGHAKIVSDEIGIPLEIKD